MQMVRQIFFTKNYSKHIQTTTHHEKAKPAYLSQFGEQYARTPHPLSPKQWAISSPEPFSSPCVPVNTQQQIHQMVKRKQKSSHARTSASIQNHQTDTSSNFHTISPFKHFAKQTASPSHSTTKRMEKKWKQYHNMLSQTTPLFAQSIAGPAQSNESNPTPTQLRNPPSTHSSTPPHANYNASHHDKLELISEQPSPSLAPPTSASIQQRWELIHYVPLAPCSSTSRKLRYALSCSSVGGKVMHFCCTSENK